MKKFLIDAKHHSTMYDYIVLTYIKQGIKMNNELTFAL